VRLNPEIQRNIWKEKFKKSAQTYAKFQFLESKLHSKSLIPNQNQNFEFIYGLAQQGISRIW
jgi:hypothetical protein